MINSGNGRFFYFIILAAVCLTGITVAAQDIQKKYDKDFCSNNWSNGDRASFRELRETNVSANSLTVDGRRNGGISVKGENRSDILIKACVQAWGETDEAARSLAKSVRVETGSNIKAVSDSDDKNFAVSYEILVPRGTDLSLTTLNGGIVISNVEGKIEFTAKNGGVILSNLAGDVKGKTSNGGLRVKLNGSSWKGNGLDVETTNGGVQVEMPENYAARFETKTVNGGFRTDFAALKVERDPNNWERGVNLSRDLNGGGATVRVITTNGGVSINSSN